MKNPQIGAHVPTKSGIENIFKHAEALKIYYVQCFTKNNRQWHYEHFNQNEIDRYNESAKNSTVKEVFSHACYLINLASQDIIVTENSKKGLTAELQRCNQLNIKWTVIHPGSHTTFDPIESLKGIAEKIAEVLATTTGHAGVLLENSAGQGSSIPYTIETLGTLFHAIKNKHHTSRIGVCIDTCHAFVAGYNLSQKESYDDFWKLVDKEIGIEYVKLIHTNDSSQALGSRVDRHAHIGEGQMGIKTFEYLMNDHRLSTIPKILETPYNSIEDLIPDIQKLMLL